MTLPELSIRRPVLTIAVSLLATIAGIIGLTRLPVREYPAIDPPTLSVSTFYPGAAAEIVEAQITEPLEAAINTVAGITSLRSQSREGGSQISVEFSLDTNLEAAASDVRDQVARIARQLPEDVDSPVLNKSDADSQPIFGLSISSDRRSQLELGAYADTLRERLQTVPGIAGVNQPAEKRYAMRLWIDAEKLRAYGLSPLDVRAAVNRENVELPSGRIEGTAVELAVKTDSSLSTPEEFNALVIKRSGDRVVRFGDVGRAELGAQNERGALKMGETPIAGLYFKPQAGANQIEIVDELRRRLAQIQHEVPDDIKVDVAYDNTEYVRRSLLEVSETIVIAFVLVVLVVFAFLREWRTTLIPVIAIPVSIVGAFGVMSAAGFSINTLTLLGIVLSIGLVVDDAIVVLENIYAKVEKGKAPIPAAIAGTNEVFTAVVATTIALVVVFLPLLFMAGMSGRLFREFGMTISGAVLISAAVALTLTPMLTSRLLKARQRHGRLFRKTEPLFTALDRSYGGALAEFLRRPWIALLVLAASGGVIWQVYGALPRELAPLEDRGRVWVRATAPEGVSYDYMQRFMDEVAAVTGERVPEAHVMMTQVPGAGGNGGSGAVNNGFVRLFLGEKSERTRSQQEIAADLRSLAREFTAARVNVTQEASMGERRSQSSGVEFVLQAPTLDMLHEVLPVFVAKAQESPVFTFVDSDLVFSSPEVRVSLAREKAQALGVSTRDIAQTVQAGMSGQRFGHFVYNGKQYDVIGQLTRDLRSRPDDLGNLTVRTMDGSQMVSLDNLISLSESSSPPELLRYNRYAAATVSGTLAPGRSLSEGIAAFEAVARDYARRALHDDAHGLGARFSGELIVARLGARARARADLSRACGAVRELRRPARDSADRAARARGRAARAVVLRPDAQHLFADRAHHVGRLGGEERNSDRGVREPTPRGRRTERARRGARSRRRALAPNPDDDARDDPRHAADRARARCGRRKPYVDGYCGDRRSRLRRCADAIRDPRDVRVDPWTRTHVRTGVDRCSRWGVRRACVRTAGVRYPVSRGDASALTAFARDSARLRLPGCRSDNK